MTKKLGSLKIFLISTFNELLFAFLLRLTLLILYNVDNALIDRSYRFKTLKKTFIIILTGFSPVNQIDTLRTFKPAGESFPNTLS